VDRRHFLGQLALGTTLLSSASPHVARAEQTAGTLKIKFVGMMGYITRSDRSIMVATPGHHPMGHFPHIPFLMARTGSPVAQALGLTSMPTVVAGAFDDTLANEPGGAFVYRCLDGCDLEVDGGATPVVNRATQLAQMYTLRKGKRLRNDLRRWSPATVLLRGGQLDNSSAHPDAGKVWSFGAHQQRLTDATLYSAPGGVVRLSAGPSVTTFAPGAGQTAELWVVSSAGPRTDVIDPKRLVHVEMLFHFFADAEPVIPTCADAEGRITLATDLPCATSASASRVVHGTGTMPPHFDLCAGGGWCDPCI
jgi:hypothetical protein